MWHGLVGNNQIKRFRISLEQFQGFLATYHRNHFIPLSLKNRFLHFYDNTRRWWRILDANPEIVFGPDLTLDDNIGATILIPRASEGGNGR